MIMPFQAQRFGRVNFQFQLTPRRELIPNTVWAVVEHIGEPDAVYVQGKLLGKSPTAARLTNVIGAVGVPHSRELLPIRHNLTESIEAQNTLIDGLGSETVSRFWQGYKDTLVTAPIQLLRHVAFQ